MKFVRLIVFATLYFGINFMAFSQEIDTIRVYSNVWGVKFVRADTLLRPNQVLESMELNSPAYRLMKSAKNNYVFSQILANTGGFLIGWPIGVAISGGDANWNMAGIGAGLLAISIPISINFRNKAKTAIHQHNQTIISSNYWKHKPKYHFGVNGTSLKLQVSF